MGTTADSNSDSDTDSTENNRRAREEEAEEREEEEQVSVNDTDNVYSESDSEPDTSTESQKESTQRELDEEARYINAKVATIVRKTYEDEDVDVYEKALAESKVAVCKDYSEIFDHIEETEANPTKRAKYMNYEARLLKKELENLPDVVTDHLIDLQNGSGTAQSAKGPLRPPSTPATGDVPRNFTDPLDSITAKLENIAATRSAAPVDDIAAPAEEFAAPSEDISRGKWRPWTPPVNESPIGDTAAPSVDDPVSNKRKYDSDSESGSSLDKGNKKVKTGSDSEPRGDAS